MFRQPCFRLALFLFACFCVLLPRAEASPACQPGMNAALDIFGNFYFLQDDGKPGGIDVDVFNELGRRLSCPAQFQTESVIRVMRREELGEVDVSAHKFDNPQRSRIAWMLPYLREVVVVLVHKEIPAQGAAGLLADSHVTLGVGTGWRYGKPVYDNFVEQMRARRQVNEAADTDELFRLLRTNRIQMLITTSVVYRRYLTERDLTQYRIEEWDKTTPDPYLNLMLSRKTVDSALTQRFDNALRDMRKDGTLRRIAEKYAAPDDIQRMLAP